MPQSRICLFCENPAGSREHVIAEWLSKAMERRDHAINRQNTIDGQVTREFPPIKFEHFVCKKVCDSCNTGWMHRLEDTFSHHFKQLVIPRSFDEGETISQSMKDNWDPLVRWLLKTAIVCSAASGKSETQIIPQEFHSTENLNLEDYEFHVFAGEMIDNDVGYQLGTGLNLMMPEGSTPKPITLQNGFQFVVQLNRLILALVHCPEHVPGMSSSFKAAGKQQFPIIPSAEVDWNMPVMHLFFSVSQFLNSIQLLPKSMFNQQNGEQADAPNA